MLNDIVKNLLKEVSGIAEIPANAAFNIRNNSKSEGRHSTENIDIVPKEGGSGLDIYVKPFTKNENVHIPALITQDGVSEVVYNDFHIGEGFFLGKNSKVVYIEKHIGEGDGSGKRIINPQTHVEAEENAYIEMDTVQLKGVDSTKRVSSAKLGPGATIVIKEKIMTHGHQTAETSFDVSLDGAGSSAKLISRSVARDFSRQLFRSKIIGNTDCYGHSECDAIIMDNGVVAAEPEIIANHVDASLVHEAAIGKIAGDQLVKLMTLGLTEKEAEAQIINGFLK